MTIKDIGDLLLAAAVLVASAAVARITKVHAERHAPPLVEPGEIAVWRGHVLVGYRCAICLQPKIAAFVDMAGLREALNNMHKACGQCVSTLNAHDWKPAKAEGGASS